jgi:hypothetical protein
MMQSFPDTNSLMRHMLDAFPDGELSTDNDGQFVIHTGMRKDQEGVIRPWDCDDFQWCVIVDGGIAERHETYGMAVEAAEEIPSAEIEWHDQPPTPGTYRMHIVT